MSGHSVLGEIIRRTIEVNGPVPFPWFMEQALYHPDFGYYRIPRQRIGRSGDFYTNVSVGPVFGEMLALQLLEMRERLDRGEPFTIVEQGAEEGQLASDVLSAIGSRLGHLPFDLRYMIVEPHPEKQKEQQARLRSDFGANVRWITEPAELESVSGVFISNELVDAFPVHIVEFQNDRWTEVLVDHGEGEFKFLRSDHLEPELAHALAKIPKPVNQPYRTEINLKSGQWIRSIASKLRSGFILIVDYGFSREEYYKPERSEGTLTAYSKHRRIGDPLSEPGNIDITAHVDFSGLAEAGEMAGLALSGFTDQHHFMIGAGEAKLRRLEQEVAASGLTKKHSAFLAGYRTLMHPGTMGMTFKYLLFQKGLTKAPMLSGFRYGGDPYRGLGMDRTGML
jgi:SAM-dependent MidA family methyltransferase